MPDPIYYGVAILLWLASFGAFLVSAWHVVALLVDGVKDGKRFLVYFSGPFFLFVSSYSVPGLLMSIR
jgi:hypothetical protein